MPAKRVQELFVLLNMWILIQRKRIFQLLTISLTKGNGVVRPRFGYAHIFVGRVRNSREHTARRECRKAGSGRAESDMRKARGDKFAARAKKKCEKSGTSLAVYCALCSDGACLGGADSLKQARISAGISATRRRRFSALFIMCSSGCLSGSRR